MIYLAGKYKVLRDDNILKKGNKTMDVNNINNPLSKEDTFNFRCKKCGKCCENLKDMILTPYDLHRVATALKISELDFVNKYCTVYIEKDSGLPLINLKTVGENSACPFLMNHECLVHRSKPMLCALYPLGRLLTHGKDDHKFEGIKYYQMCSCGETDEKITVREWLEKYGILDSEKFYVKWLVLKTKMKEIMSEVEKLTGGNRNNEMMKRLFHLILEGVYFDYTPDCNFMEKYDSNAERIVFILETVKDKIKRG